MMKKNAVRVAFAGFMIAVTSAWWLPVTSTAKPPAPPPPPPLPLPCTACAYYDASGHPYGGFYDPKTHLVWGFNVAEDYQGAQSFWTWSGASALKTVWACCGLNAAGSLCTYNQFANCFWGRTDADWRLPTLSELQTAHANGVFLSIDASPNDGFQGIDWDFLVWSATKKKSKSGGEEQINCLHVQSGDTQIVGANSGIAYFPVRGPVSP